MPQVKNSPFLFYAKEALEQNQQYSKRTRPGKARIKQLAYANPEAYLQQTTGK
jgi:hypothetical protein